MKTNPFKIPKIVLSSADTTSCVELTNPWYAKCIKFSPVRDNHDIFLTPRQVFTALQTSQKDKVKLCDITDTILWPRSPLKELSLCHKLWFYNPYIFATGWRKPFIFQTYMIWANISHSLKYLSSMSLGCKDIGIIKSKFVAKT